MFTNMITGGCENRLLPASPQSHKFPKYSMIYDQVTFVGGTTHLFSVSMSHYFVLLDSMYKRDHTVLVFLWFISLSTMPSRSIHVVKNGRISFFYWLNNIPLCVYVYTFYNNETCSESLLEYVTVLILFKKYWLSTCLALCSWDTFLIELKSSSRSECLQCGYSSFLWRTCNNKAYSWATWHEKEGIIPSGRVSQGHWGDNWEPGL